MNTKTAAAEHKEQPKGLRLFAMIVSYIFHPVMMPTLMMLVLYQLSPVSFAGTRIAALMLPVVLNTMFFPVVVTLLIKAVGFIESIHMHDPKDRIIPLIATMIFYFWVNNVFSNLPGVPLIAHVLTLGAFWGIIAIFMINIFFKISMHTVAAGGALGMMVVLMITSRVNMIAPFFAALIAAGLVGTARMVLGAHRNSEIWLGYIVGVLVQLGAYWYLA